MGFRAPLSLVAVTAATALALSGCAAPDPDPAIPPAATSEAFTPMVASVAAAPIPYPATDGAWHLAYELTLTNALSQVAHLEGVEVLGDGESLLRLEGDELDSWIRTFSQGNGVRDLNGGESAFVWLDVVVASEEDVPAVLEHRLDLEFDEEIPPLVTSPMSETVAAVGVQTSSPIVIGPPLTGERWLNANGCCDLTAHRGAISPINGQFHAPERFAIDFVRLTEQGRLFDGPVDELSSYEFYGADVIAVADGPIVGVLDGLEEQVPGTAPTGLAITEYGGNHVVQDIGDGHYAFYAHLQGPLDVKVGQDLERGDVIGQLGNTGNSDAPHLHFHVMDSPLPLASNGLPFVIDTFTLEGTVEGDALDRVQSGDPMPIDTSDAGTKRKQGSLTGNLLGLPPK